MSKGKTGLIVVVFLAAMFFVFIAVLFGSSTKRQGAIDKKEELESKFDTILENDITVYWIGSVPSDFEYMSSVIKEIPPESVSASNLPVKGPSFHVTEYNSDGLIVNEQVPKEYSRYMLIVISGNPALSDSGKAALSDAVAQNGVPVLSVGDEASDLLCEILSYHRYKTGPGSSLYYCLGAGYKQNPLAEDAVKEGGFDLASAVADFIPVAMTDYTPRS